MFSFLATQHNYKMNESKLPWRGGVAERLFLDLLAPCPEFFVLCTTAVYLQQQTGRETVSLLSLLLSSPAHHSGQTLLPKFGRTTENNPSEDLINMTWAVTGP